MRRCSLLVVQLPFVTLCYLFLFFFGRKERERKGGCRGKHSVAQWRTLSLSCNLGAGTNELECIAL